jgi:hypothetical protein
MRKTRRLRERDEDVGVGSERMCVLTSGQAYGSAGGVVTRGEDYRAVSGLPFRVAVLMGSQ